MPYLTGAVLAGGPLVHLRIEVSVPRALALRRAGQAVPQAVDLRALLDTGADATCIDTRQVPFLAQETPAFTIVGTPAGGWTVGLQYDVSLTVVHPQSGKRSSLVFPSLPIVDVALAPFLGYEALVGRDVLERCLLVYDGQGKTFTLAY
jgi:hypothetical protein